LGILGEEKLVRNRERKSYIGSKIVHFHETGNILRRVPYEKQRCCHTTPAGAAMAKEAEMRW
jgi:hypothetical protein